jgi:TolB-like protein/Flp pilus assembly protein TadD
MGTGQRDGQDVREELLRVLSSAYFARTERTSKLLRFLVERQLDGREGELKESTIGVEVFGRNPDYDPKVDSTVRTEAVRLRARLSKYYSTEGTRDPLVIDLPKGGYVPTFRQPDSTPEVQTAGPRRHRAAIALAGLSLAVVVAGIGARWTLRKNAPIPIAVLPLVNLSQDPANEYFADGLTDEIIRNLSILEGLAVRSQTSSFAFKNKARDVREAARQLQADYILEGSVMRAGRQLRINAQLVRARDDYPVWSGRFDKELTDVFAIQDEISRGIVNGLRLTLGRGRRRYETSTEAYDFYLRARALGLRDGRSVDAFEEAIAKDPAFAPAYAGLAEAHAYRSGLFHLDPAGEVSKMQVAAEKAIQLDPMLAEAHDALGMCYAREARWQQAENSFQRAIELAPNRSETYAHFAAFLLWPLDRTEQAIRQLRVAQKTDPLSNEVLRVLCYVLPSAGRYDQAAASCEKLPVDFPFRRGYLGRARFLQGRTAEAIQILEATFHRGVPPGAEVRAFLGYAYARTGRRQEAEQMAIGTNPFNQAVVFAGLGDKERALQAMERSAAAGPFRVGRQLTWPELAFIRSDPRMKVLRKKVGLPQ